MKKKTVIIDNVNVRECKHYRVGFGLTPHFCLYYYPRNCEKHPDCNFKTAQLKNRLEKKDVE